MGPGDRVCQLDELVSPPEECALIDRCGIRLTRAGRARRGVGIVFGIARKRTVLSVLSCLAVVGALAAAGDSMASAASTAGAKPSTPAQRAADVAASGAVAAAPQATVAAQRLISGYALAE